MSACFLHLQLHEPVYCWPARTHVERVGRLPPREAVNAAAPAAHTRSSGTATSCFAGGLRSNLRALRCTAAHQGQTDVQPDTRAALQQQQQQQKFTAGFIHHRRRTAALAYTTQNFTGVRSPVTCWLVQLQAQGTCNAEHCVHCMPVEACRAHNSCVEAVVLHAQQMFHT